MARSRSIPTDFFDDPDIFLCNPSSQLLLLALVLFADDHGRGLASVPWLANRLKLEDTQVQASLVDLEEVELIQRYQVGRHSYYHLCHWQQWETLSRPSVPKYPAPPTGAESSAPHAQSGPSAIEEATANFSENPPTNSGESEKRSAEEEEEGKKNKKRREMEEEWAPSSASPSSLSFLERSSELSVMTNPVGSREHALLPGVNTEEPIQADQERSTRGSSQKPELSARLGSILHLPHNDALVRLVEEFLPDPGLSLIAEADAARAWVDDQSRNRHGTVMSLSFFRRWLRREQEGTMQRWQKNMGGSGFKRASTSRAAQGRGATRTPEPNPYTAFVEQRIRQVKEAFAAGIPAEDIVAGRYQHAAAQ